MNIFCTNKFHSPTAACTPKHTDQQQSNTNGAHNIVYHQPAHNTHTHTHFNVSRALSSRISRRWRHRHKMADRMLQPSIIITIVICQNPTISYPRASFLCLLLSVYVCVAYDDVETIPNLRYIGRWRVWCVWRALVFAIVFSHNSAQSSCWAVRSCEAVKGKAWPGMEGEDLFVPPTTS